MANEELTESTETTAEVVPTPVAGVRKAAPTRAGSNNIHGLGRRKTAVARVLLRPGEGRWVINGRTLDQHFPRPILQQSITRPLVLTHRAAYLCSANLSATGSRCAKVASSDRPYATAAEA